MGHLDQIEKTFRRLNRLGHLGSIVGWDEAVNMPTGGGQKRAEAMAELSVLRAEILQDEKLKDQFEKAKSEIDQSNKWQVSHFNELESSWKKATALPVDLIEAQSLASSNCEQAWRKLRSENNWKDFLPLFKKVVELAKEEAQIRSEITGLDLYNSMLDLYEPSARHENITAIFNDVKGFLPQLIKDVVEKQKGDSFIDQKGSFPTQAQKDIGLEVMKMIGFDFNHGRLDVSHHPFCGGVPTDVRLTTRYDEDDFTQSLMGVVHETGHARYEQGLPVEWGDFPVGTARSMGIHESQSLFYEMQLGRSRAFLKKLAPICEKHFTETTLGKDFFSAENMFKLYTRVRPGYIRVDADEVTYPAHVILRYEIEKSLLEGSIKVEDIPELWNEKMWNYLGVDTKDDYKNGCMQDVHWPSGAIGYFPTYTLGAMNAAQIYKKMDQDLGGIENRVDNNDFISIGDWLKEKIWKWGSFYSIDDLMIQATGETLNPKIFEEHLRNRYL